MPGSARGARRRAGQAPRSAPGSPRRSIHGSGSTPPRGRERVDAQPSRAPSVASARTSPTTRGRTPHRRIAVPCSRSASASTTTAGRPSVSAARSSRERAEQTPAIVSSVAAARWMQHERVIRAEHHHELAALATSPSGCAPRFAGRRPTVRLGGRVSSVTSVIDADRVAEPHRREETATSGSPGARARSHRSDRHAAAGRGHRRGPGALGDALAVRGARPLTASVCSGLNRRKHLRNS